MMSVHPRRPKGRDMLSILFWTIVVLMGYTLLTLPSSAHSSNRVTPGVATFAIAMIALEVWLSISLFAHHDEPSTLAWVAVVFLVGGG